MPKDPFSVMKVQLVFAPALAKSALEVRGESMWPPLGILYLASYLRSKMPEADIKITDGALLGFQKTWEEIEAFKPDILGISFYTMSTHGASTLARQAKERLPGTIIIMGGPHATALPLETLRQSHADLVVIGEGEIAFSQIVQAVNAGLSAQEIYKLPGVWAIERNGEKEIVHENPAAQFASPLDILPSPAWDLIDFTPYEGWYLSKQSPEAAIFSARGCPYWCAFCSNAVWKSSRPTLRLRSAKNVVDELEMLSRKYGIREFFDQADEFNNSLENALEICRELKKRNLGMTWKTQLRVKPFTEELAKAMAEAGCWYVHLGIETGNQETIEGTGKKIDLRDVETTCALLKKYNIKVLGLFMLYNVWEEDGQLRFEDSKASLRTLEFARGLFKKRLIDYISWSITAPYPGSKLFDIARRHNLIDPRLLTDWEAWQKEEIFLMSLPGISRKEQQKVKRKGEFLRVCCLLRSWQFKLKDIPFMIKRGLHLLIASRAK